MIVRQLHLQDLILLRSTQVLEHEVGVDHGGDALGLRGGLKQGETVKREEQFQNS